MADGLSDHKKAKRRKKLIKYIVIVAVFKAIVATIFVLAVVRLRSPRLRIAEIRLQTLEHSSPPAQPSFDLGFVAEARVKNPNFLFKYEYEETTVSFVYEGIVVGQTLVPAGRVGMRSTREVRVSAAASSRSLSGIAGNAVAAEIGAGVLSLQAKAVMRGKFEVMRVLKKRKNAEMDCFVVFNLAMKIVQRLECQ